MRALKGMASTSLIAIGLLCFLALVPSCRKNGGEEAVQKTGQSEPVYRIGYMICDGIEEAKRRFEPLTRYLSKATGLEFTSAYLNTFDVPEAFEKGELDITQTNSLLYIIMAEKGLLPLAGERRGSMGFRSAGGIAVKADSPIKTLADLKGKRMVFGPMLAPTGYLSQYDMLLEAGIDPELDLEYYAIPWGAYKHEKVIYGVWMAAYDAAAVPMLDMEIMERENRIGKGDLRVIAVNDPIPYCVFGVAPRVPGNVAAAVKSALLNLTGGETVPIDGQVLSVLKSAKVDGFVPIEDADFDRVREMAKKANMPPYQKY